MKTARLASLVGMATLLGCAQSPPPAREVTNFGSLQGTRATKCAVQSPASQSFGIMLSEFKMTLVNNNGWCSVFRARANSDTPGLRFHHPDAHMSENPSHGEVQIRNESGTYFDYKPQPGFTGADHFEAKVGGSQSFVFDVTVTK